MPETPQVIRGFGVTFLTIFKKVVTEQYPEQKVPPKPPSRAKSRPSAATCEPRA